MLDLTKEQIEQRKAEAMELAAKLRSQNEWDFETCENLCDLAGMEGEWDSATGDNFEEVVYAAAAIFGLEI